MKKSQNTRAHSWSPFFLLLLYFCCSKCLDDYMPTHVFPLNVYLGEMASYFERKEEKTDCRGNRTALHLPGQWISKITRLHGRESHLHVFLRCK